MQNPLIITQLKKGEYSQLQNGKLQFKMSISLKSKDKQLTVLTKLIFKLFK